MLLRVVHGRTRRWLKGVEKMGELLLFVEMMILLTVERTKPLMVETMIPLMMYDRRTTLSILPEKTIPSTPEDAQQPMQPHSTPLEQYPPA